MLSVANLAVRRGRVLAVDDVSFTAPPAQWVGVIGANGSGKTSLLRALAGRLPTEGGRIMVDGVDVSGDRAARARAVGFAVEPRWLPGMLTPREVFSISAEAPDAAEHPGLKGLRRALGIDALLDRRCGSLSSGNAQRVAIFAAFLDRRPIVVLDEPFNWLDPLTAYDLKVALRRFVDDERVLLITALHDFSTLTVHCDQAVLMANGVMAMRLDTPALRRGLADPMGFEREMAERLRG